MQLDGAVLHSGAGEHSWPILICLLGHFQVLKSGQPVAIHGGKTEALLCNLALQRAHCASRDTLLHTLWPDGDSTLASQSLNSLIYNLRKILGDGMSGAAPVLHAEGHYRLNTAAGVRVDVACFDELSNAGDRQVRASNLVAATELYNRALNLYRGDLCIDNDLHAIIERERLRARHLTLLSYLGEYYYSMGDDESCLTYALRLLDSDPCREDAHRLAMRCYVRRGERAQALHQYRLCQTVLRAEFDTEPEPTTQALFDQVRLNPDGV